jgi:2-amino-4-hydroxy-6-hydroxymethyldihydropteridine diphosphokinase
MGSNMRHVRHGGPKQVLRAAVAAMAVAGIEVLSASRVYRTAPLGPSRRTYANAAAVVRTELEPPDLLIALQSIEAKFGRCRRGQRWTARVLDLDIVLWSEGAWSGPSLTIPHVAFRERAFVLRPASEVAAQWRDPITGRTVGQLLAVL